MADTGPSPAKKQKKNAANTATHDAPSSKPACKYGSNCFRKNPQHLKDFDHPKSSKTDDKKTSTATPSTSQTASASLSASAVATAASKLPPCKYGAHCYRKNLLHFTQFSHPSAQASEDKEDSDATDMYDSSDDESNKGAVKDVLKRGLSLVKSFSKLTEDQKKQLIEQAFAAKKQLEDELEKTKKEIERKAKQVERLQEQVNKGIGFVDGEEDALNGENTVYFSLQAERDYKEGSPDQLHFRLAESQFYRLMSGDSDNSGCRVDRVEYVVNPKLVKKFREAREDLKKHRSEKMSYPVLAFHGTDEDNIRPICETGFRVPGEQGFSHATDTGWYGLGVYFSEYPAYAMDYIQGSQMLLLCQVLPGKVFTCKNVIHGENLKNGYDSHTSPDKKELVIFNSYHILPVYLVHFSDEEEEFAYKALKKSKVTPKKPHPNIPTDDDIPTKYAKAWKVPSTKLFENDIFMFSGTMFAVRKEMFKLLKKHKGEEGTGSKFTLLVCGEDEYEKQTNKVTTAIAKDIPCIREEFIYDCLLAKKRLKVTDYVHE
ncbi:uncharacterized protein LOC135500253 [Lineus longissimus]|uniref:uncharacterized protein LOC135500253 n=1 Tax=Lineus longissimus TaxID=88925 RepID=UPI00315D5EEA